jgi:hypothetical protein
MFDYTDERFVIERLSAMVLQHLDISNYWFCANYWPRNCMGGLDYFLGMEK